jgi:2-methylcitrate dehydratase PrpD
LARTISSARPDDAAREAARSGILDFIGVALGGAATDSGVTAVRRALGIDDGSSVVIGSAVGARSADAAVVNGYLGHALDYDDFHPDVRGHPSTVILPALLAAATDSTDATAMLDSYVVGVEVAARLGNAVGPLHYPRGFHSTATLGTVAAAASVARLRGLSIGTTTTALGLAATQSAGLRAQFGSQAKPLHAGLAARAGLQSADFAAAGLSGNADVLAGTAGFFDVFGFDAQNPASLLDGWGDSWRIVSPGLVFKRFPTCGGTHQAADAALALHDEIVRKRQLAPEEIVDIGVSFPVGADEAPNIRRPADGVEARFSLEYVVAAALIDGSVSLSRFGEVPVDGRIDALARKVRRSPDHGVPPDSENPDGRFADVTATLANGEVVTEHRSRGQTTTVPIDLAEKFSEITGNAPAFARIPTLISGLNSDGGLAALRAAVQVDIAA